MAGIKVKAIFRLPTIDGTWKQKLADESRETLAKAVFAWITAATAPIPTWSGASLATFQHLASEINYNLSIRPTRNGTRFGLGPSAGIDASEGSFSESRGLYQATYATTLRHLIYNEFHNANIDPDPELVSSLRSPGPYDFQQKGNDAARPILSSIKVPPLQLRSGKVIRI